MEEIKYSGGKEICVALGVTILLALFLFRVEDSYRIGLLLVVGALLLLRPLCFLKWSLLDGCVAVLALSDLFSCFYAACPIPALDAAFYAVYMLVTYFVCRRLFRFLFRPLGYITNILPLIICRIGTTTLLTPAIRKMSSCNICMPSLQKMNFRKNQTQY